MRRIAFALMLLLAFNTDAFAQRSHIRIFATAIANDSAGAFMGGSSNGSGLYQSDDTGKTWRHLGWENIKAYSMDVVQSSNGRILYLATGLGVLRSTDYGEKWRVLTDWRIAEAMDIAVNQKNPKEIYIATAHGPWRSRDGGATWQQLLSGLSVPYCSRVVIDSAKFGHILLAASDGIFVLRRDSIWSRIPSNQRNIKNEIEHPAQEISDLVQTSTTSWLAASGNSRKLLSRDSGKSFGTPSSGSIGLWTVAQVSVMYAIPNDQTATWGVTVGGGPSGAFTDGWEDDVVSPEHFDSVKNVHACLAILDTGENTQHDCVAIFGTLGSGIFVMNKREREAHLRSASRRMIQRLAGRQIWTLKSFLVHE